MKQKSARKRCIREILDSVSDESQKNEMLQILSKLPQLKPRVDMFFLKSNQLYHSSDSIARNLIESALPTTEHLNPKSGSGINDTKNYIVDCQECNNTRKNMSFYDWAQKYPALEANLNEYLKEVQKNIDDCKLPLNYTLYPDEVIDTIFMLSRGQIKLKKPQDS